MSDTIEGQGAQPTADTTPAQPAQGEGAKGAPSTDHKARRLARENEQLKARLASIEAASKTEAEKAIEAAREDGRKAAQAEVQRERINNAVSLALRDSGISGGLADDLAIAVIGKFGADIETTEDAKRIASDYAKTFLTTAKTITAPTPAGVSGAPTPRTGTDLSAEAISKMDPKEYQKHLPEILARMTRGN